MAEAPRKRGRPKGSGIDDGTTLAAIARLRTADPDLKPTTAIRKLGITDPSVVRRLRDKLKEWPDVARAAQTSLLASTISKDRPAKGTIRTKPEKPKNRRQKSKVPLAGPISATVTARQDDFVHQSSGNDAKSETTAPSRRDEATPDLPRHTASSSTPTRADAAPIAPPAKEPDTSSAPASQSPETARPDPDPTRTSTPPPQFAMDPQLEAMRLAAEAAAAMSRLYLHCLTYANQVSPLAIAMRGQAMSTQWFAAAMAGHQAALKTMMAKKG